ncbi:hypothetical protein L843_3747 [Mycobacterium intracellulare MIN_061107_1834]|nr:hypothetical protein L843_3747 [Mycobacterium intracellulare MIN_061107_1834]
MMPGPRPNRDHPCVGAYRAQSRPGFHQSSAATAARGAFADWTTIR